MKNTALPWKIGSKIAGKHISKCIDHIVIEQSGDTPKYVACTLGYNSTEERDANAALIVRAVNSHEALVEACKSVLDLLSKTAVITMEGIPFNHHSYINELQAALEATKGE